MHSTPITFESDGARLSGTLTLPPREGPHPVVGLLHGASWGCARCTPRSWKRLSKPALVSATSANEGEHGRTSEARTQ